jgi:uncharacterized integral membrane protein
VKFAGVVYQGRFGPWTIEPEDVREVWAYRAGITLTALTASTAAASAFLSPDSAAAQAITAALDPLCLAGAVGLGASLQLIHIYVAPLKRALQAFWLLGTVGGVYLMLNDASAAHLPAAMFVAQQPWAMWLVGPLFAALTGVAFKEGFCYGKWEAAGLFGTIPLLCLGHLTGLVNEDGQRGMLAAMIIMLAIFAGRKYTQVRALDL